jgi:hypothetical protein
MCKKMQYDVVVGNIIIYKYNNCINMVTILYLHLMMTRYKIYYKRKKLRINNLEIKIKKKF